MTEKWRPFKNQTWIDPMTVQLLSRTSKMKTYLFTYFTIKSFHWNYVYHQFILFLKYFQHAEFDWSKTTQSTILASFFYGYIVTQIPAGWLADRFGGRRVFGIGMLIASICTLVFPVCARISVNLVYALRVLLGLSTVRKKIIISKYHKIKLKI